MNKSYGIPIRERESVFINIEKRISTKPDIKTIYGDYSKLDYIPCRHKPTLEETMRKMITMLRKGLSGRKNDDIDDCLSWVDLRKAEPGTYGNASLLDVDSKHPSSIVAKNSFGDEYTEQFKEIWKGGEK